MLLGWRQITLAARPLPSAIRLQMEKLFRTSFSDVTYKLGPEAASIGARAFVSGTRLFFAPDAWDPQSCDTHALIAHELAHVVQQRSRRLMDGIGANAGLLYEPALEAEADGMAGEARRHWKSPANNFAAVSRGTLDIAQPFEMSEGSYQIAVGLGSLFAGSVHVHESGTSAIEITDLKVRPEFRRRGMGRVLVHAALQTGLHLAKTYAVLASGDSGSGRLSSWYERLGFGRSGFQRGYIEYSARIARALPGIALFTAPPLRGQLIQCMEDDEEARRRRAARFGIDPEQKRREEERRQEEIRRLKQLFLGALHEYTLNMTHFVVLGSARKHGDHNPQGTFVQALLFIAAHARFDLVEVQDVNGEEINITLRLGNGMTVTAAYSFRYRTFTIFHSGPTTSGVGYGTHLG